MERLRLNEIALDDVRHHLTEAARMERALTPSAEWLLDNSYLVRTQISEVRAPSASKLPEDAVGERFHTRSLPGQKSGRGYGSLRQREQHHFAFRGIAEGGAAQYGGAVVLSAFSSSRSD